MRTSRQTLKLYREHRRKKIARKLVLHVYTKAWDARGVDTPPGENFLAGGVGKRRAIAKGVPRTITAAK